VARAKRTDRAEARRQYRAFLQAQADAEAAAAAAAGNVTEEAAPAPSFSRRLFGGSTAAPAAAVAAPAGRISGSRPGATPAPKGQMGFFPAMRVAYKPVNYREDLAFLPRLVTRTNAVWPGALLSIVAMVVYLNETDPNGFWRGMATLALPPYPLIPGMLAGIAAPRAGWLAGVVTGAVSGVCMWVIIAAAAATVPNLATLHGSDLAVVGAEWMLTAVCFGALIGAMSAWYRRFLSLVMVPRNGSARSSSRSSAKKPVRRNQPTKK
jgi:hypothetical protein